MAHYAMKELVSAVCCLMLVSLCICFCNVIGGIKLILLLEALIVEMTAKHKTQTNLELYYNTIF
jgi:hypothetical protein